MSGGSPSLGILMSARAWMMELAGAALRAIDPGPLVADLVIDRPTALLALGKAAPSMMRAALLRSPGLPALAVAKFAEPVEGAALWVGGHPWPDERSERAFRHVEAFLRALPDDTHILALVSGGTSALVEAPRPPVTLADIVTMTRAMDRAGAPIQDLNTVRAALSLCKAGGLLVLAPRARWTCAVLSDVPGNDPAVVGSGPCVPGPLPRDPHEVLARWVPRASWEPHWAQVLATPRPELQVPVDVRLLAGVGTAGHAAAAEASRRGLHLAQVEIPPGFDTAKAAQHFVEAARQACRSVVRIGSRRGGCGTVGAWWCGETQPGVPAGPSGGRNQHAALAALPYLGGGTLLCLATDGEDGPSGAGGALVDEACARAFMPEDVSAALAEGCAGTLLAKVGAVLPGRRTGTNTADLWIWLSPGAVV